LKKIIISIIAIILIGNLSAQQKKIYLAPDDHTDYMWTSNEEGYTDAFVKTLDYYISLNDSTANSPYNLQSKWNCDGSLWVYAYEKNRSKEQFAQLIRQMKEGKITVPYNTVANVMGIAPTEATLRDMYYAGGLERRFGVNLELAINMEDQVLPLGLSSLWAGAGVKYSWRGVCNCATRVTGLKSRTNEIYWYKGLDDQKVLMKWYSVMINNTNLGGYAEARYPTKSIEMANKLMESPGYPYSIVGVFGKGWDDLLTTSREFIDVAKSNTSKDYEVVVSNEIDFFRDFEKNYGENLPSETISYGSTEWGNSVASLAEVSATVKRSIEKLRTAEALYTLVALKDKQFATNLSDQREKAWIACGKYFEHDWTSDGPITRKQRADWQRKLAKQLGSYVDTLYQLSISRLGEMVAKPVENQEFFYVFNPLSWIRTDYSDYPYNGAKDIVVTDQITGKEVPYQFIQKNGKMHLRILAADIPSLGYKVFGIKKGVVAKNSEMAATVTNGVIENDFYKIHFTTEGVITSLIDKKNANRECINPINKLYANDLGPGTGQDELNDSILRVENAGPVSVTLVAQTYNPMKHISKITLFKNNNRIELENFITQNIGEKPAIYSFSFNMNKPETWHEEAGAILKVRPDYEGGHYIEENCRLDWIAMNHFADMSAKGQGMMLSNRDAYFMKTGNSRVENLDFNTPQINVLAAGQIDKEKGLGIENQDGDSYFENFFALKPYSEQYNATSSMKFALEHQNPMVSGAVSGKSNDYNSQYSLFKVSNPNVLVWAVKPAEEGIDKGIILRIWNQDGKDADCIISAESPILKAIKTTHVEVDGASIIPVHGALRTSIGHNRIETYRVYVE
jgi:alpha-mannosidase